MTELTKHLYPALGALLLLAVLAPTLIQLAAVVVPLAVITELVIVAVRLVWFHTTRY
jgi:hypothetical protein